MEERILKLPAFLSRVFPIHDAIPAPLCDGQPLDIVDCHATKPINYSLSLVVGEAKTCKTSLWWQAAMSYVAEGRNVLGICEKVDRRPNPVRGMPPNDAKAAQKFLLKYANSREEFVQALTELVELTKISSLPDVILIDDLHVLTGSSDVDSDSDYSLAKVFAVLKNVVASIEARKARDCQSTNRNIGQDDKAMSSSSVTVVIFSAPLQSRGSSLVNVCQSFFDSIFDVCRLDSHDDPDRNKFSLTPSLSQGGGYRILFSHHKENFIRIDSMQLASH